VSPLPAAEDLETVVTGKTPGAMPAEDSTWLPVDLEPALKGENTEPRPSILIRSDGHPLIYRQKFTSIAAEPEAGKTRLLLHAIVEIISTGDKAVLIDFETTTTEAVNGLLDLGANADDIRQNFIYISPDAALDDLGWAQMEPHVRDAALVVMDGVNEVYSLQALNPNDPVDVAKYHKMLPKRIREFGPAVVEIDHVVKNRESRGNWQMGSGHKKAGIDVGLMLTVVKPFGRGVSGSSKLSITKDRPGHLRPIAVNGNKDLALVNYIAGENGKLSIRLDPIGAGESTFRPTYLMERISQAVEGEPGITKNGIRQAVHGKNDAKDTALAILIEEGFIRLEVAGQSHRHHSIKAYRQEGEE